MNLYLSFYLVIIKNFITPAFFPLPISSIKANLKVYTVKTSNRYIYRIQFKNPNIEKQLDHKRSILLACKELLLSQASLTPAALAT